MGKYTVVHKKSNVLVNGLPKLPSASTLEYGEIAVNYAQSGETLSIRNSADQVIMFPALPTIEKMLDNAVSGINKTIEDDEYVTADALNDLHNRVQTLEDNPADLSGLVSSVTYNSQTKRIIFYDVNGDAIGTYVDTTDFVKDGMVDTVTIGTPTGGTNSGVTCLIITFNTDAGKEDIELPISSIFNPNNYYDKTTADGLFLTGYTETDPTVPAWAKAANKPTYSASEVGAMATSERNNYLTTATTIPSTAAEVGAMDATERNNYIPTGTTLDDIPDGNVRQLSKYAYTSHTHSEYITGVNVNGSASTVTGGVAEITIPSGLPAVTASDNGKILLVVNGAWALVTPTMIYTGSGTPDAQTGNDGDIYLQTS